MPLSGPVGNRKCVSRSTGTSTVRPAIYDRHDAHRTLRLPFSSYHHLVVPVLLVSMRVFASVLLAVSSVFAYQVTSPGESQGWTTTGPNTLTWQRVDTDPLNFTTVLINQVSLFVRIFSIVL